MALTDEQWVAVRYEMEMFFWTQDRCKQGQLTKYEANACVEAELLHIRILTEALTKKHGDRGYRKTDIVLQDMVPERSMTPRLQAVITELRRVYGDGKVADSPYSEINQRVAHLTERRGSSYHYGRVFAAMEPALEAVLVELVAVVGNDVFVGVLPPRLTPARR